MVFLLEFKILIFLDIKFLAARASKGATGIAKAAVEKSAIAKTKRAFM